MCNNGFLGGSGHTGKVGSIGNIGNIGNTANSFSCQLKGMTRMPSFILDHLDHNARDLICS